MERVRLGCPRYLNTAPLTEGLERLDGVEVTRSVPSLIGPMLASGQVDIGLCSVADLATLPVPVALLRVGAIGCDGPTLTVRLFSRVPFEAVRCVHADSDSRTSVVLCGLMLRELFGVEAAMVEFDARERVAVGERPSRLGEGRAGVARESSVGADGEFPEAMLLIGDKVVADSPPAERYPHQLDLGEAWKRVTGLPFVYAVWMCRAAEADSPRIRTASAVLDRQRRRNEARLGWLARARAGDHRWPAEEARRYLGSLLRFGVGPRERQAVDVFLSKAADGGLLPRREAAWV